MMDLSKSYSLLTLSDYAVIYSDNIAYHMIMRIVGYQNVKDYYSKIVNDNIQTNENGTMLISSNYACILLKKLYENIDSNYLYERMIENMKTNQLEKISNLIKNVKQIVKSIPIRIKIVAVILLIILIAIAVIVSIIRVEESKQKYEIYDGTNLD